MGCPAAAFCLSYRQASLLADVTDCTEMPVMLSDHASLYGCSLKLKHPSLKIAQVPSALPQQAATALYTAQFSVPDHYRKSSITRGICDRRKDQQLHEWCVINSKKKWQLPQTAMSGLTAVIYSFHWFHVYTGQLRNTQATQSSSQGQHVPHLGFADLSPNGKAIFTGGDLFGFKVQISRC